MLMMGWAYDMIPILDSGGGSYLATNKANVGDPLELILLLYDYALMNAPFR